MPLIIMHIRRYYNTFAKLLAEDVVEKPQDARLGVLCDSAIDFLGDVRRRRERTVRIFVSRDGKATAQGTQWCAQLRRSLRTSGWRWHHGRWNLDAFGVAQKAQLVSPFVRVSVHLEQLLN